MDREEVKSTTSKRTTRSQSNNLPKGDGQVIDNNLVDNNVNASKNSRHGSVCEFNDDILDHLCKSSVKSMARSRKGNSISSAATGRLNLKAISNALKEEEESSKRALEQEELLADAEALERKAAARRRHSDILSKVSEGRERVALELSQMIDEEDSEEDDMASAMSTRETETHRRKANRDLMSSYLDDCQQTRRLKPVGEVRSSKIGNSQGRRDASNQHKLIKTEMPRIELPKFDGDVAEYWNFKRQFEIHIEGRTDDDEQRMLYLLNHCVGKAKEAIRGCGNMAASEGYAEAMETLQRMYGKPHVISENMIKDMLRLPNIRQYDEEGLNRLLLSMAACYRTLSQMKFMSDLNASNTLKQIVDKLPNDIIDRWVVKTNKMYHRGLEPKFIDLRRFIEEEVSIAGNRFADRRKREAASTKPNMSTGFQRTDSKWRYTGNNREEVGRADRNVVVNYTDQAPTDRLRCIMCKEAHSTAQCKEYIGLPVTQRWDTIKTGGGCFSCLGTGHSVKDCKHRKPCGINECTRRHHPSLHREQEVIKAREIAVLSSLRATNSYVSLGFMPVVIEGPNGLNKICALLDTGSNTTLIRKEVAHKLGITGEPMEIEVHTVAGSTTMKANKCNMTVQASDRTDKVQMQGVYAVDQLPLRLHTRAIQEDVDRWPHLKGIPRTEMGGCLVEMIIGCDQSKAHWVQEVKLGKEGQPFGLKTPLGWIVLGPMHQAAIKAAYCTDVQERKEDELEALMHGIYNKEFEDLGSNDKCLSVEEKEAVDILTKGVSKEGNQYVVPLPWKEFPPALVDNRQYAEKRLNSLRRRFHTHPELIGRYDKIFREHISKGYIAPVSPSEIGSIKAWYLPHHPVFNPHKPDKLRIVFDCAARYRNRSINDCLHQGPDTIMNLVGVLLRFRRSPVVIIADIEEMFLQVKLVKEEQDWMRFLWWKNGEIGGEVGTFKMLVHPFGARSSPFCANFALKQAVLDNQADLSKLALDIANKNIYVDDCIASVDNMEDASRVVTELTTVMKKGGFRLRKWLSNRKEVLANVPAEDLSSKVQLLTNSDLPVERTLGVEWDAEGDVLRFTFQDHSKPNTRRGVLSVIAAVFDPLGLISPIIMKAKILLQGLCRKKLDWDHPLEEKDLKDWIEWKRQMEPVNKLEFPRCVKQDNADGGLQLHVFADASEVGYGAAAYIRAKVGEVYQCRLLMSKARVAPLKVVTIPRLELNAAVLAVRLSKVIMKEMEVEFESIYFWVDSTIVLHYLRNTSSRFVTFVANRIQEILEATKVAQWRHVRSELNPADYTSRGLLVNDERIGMWLNGPEFLREAEDSWPEFLPNEMKIETLEVRKAVLHVEVREEAGLGKLLSHYSEWTKMIRAVTWMTRFAEYYKVMKGKATSVRVGRLTVKELSEAEEAVVQYVQTKEFEEEYKALTNKESKFDWRVNRLRKLSPELRGNLLVVGGRLQSANINEDRKHPIILPKDHAVTTAIIRHVHQQEGHAGIGQTLANLREKYWIVNGGATVKRVLRKCLICRRLNATSMNQRMAPLPEARVMDGWSPFQYVGMDYFGPFMVRRGRLLERRYGCIFTCMQCRAIHLELAQTLSTDSFILALMRFINRRGTPVELMSDNGGNFIGAERELGTWLRGLNQDRITDQLTNKKITWKFNPPHASHRGGVWERLIRSVRKILNSVAGRQSMDEEVLWTYLTQAERIINDRPLTAVREGKEEPKPIRASDLLHPKSNSFVALNLPLSQLVERRWKVVNSLTAEFWKKWKTDYLDSLQERQKWFRKERELQIGDVVITEVESTPRTFWPLGVIEQVTPDGDGIVRTVLIRTSSGVSKRDIRKVYMLEGSS